MAATSVHANYPQPAMRRLRIYAFDPHASIELETAVINDAIVELPWETRWEDKLEIGPVNEYLEVIDYDPACGLFYEPVDLNDPVLLAQNGLPPSEGRPQFHQQMVFAVAMRTIRNFERALGRPLFWTREPPPDLPNDTPDKHFVKRLRIYPHALREPNAYYSPDKAALLFGYFRKEGASDTGEGWVFTCLSQDIIAHETTHAILHGMQKRSIEPTSPDSLAFHEAFADIVALFQHFSLSSVVEHELERSKGSLRDETLLTGLAQQFGKAIGRKGALRYAFEKASAKAGGTSPELAESEDESEPHARGQKLVGAIFDAFVTIYERRTADLMRLSGDAATRSLSPDLVKRLASEARKAADHILRMCVRALDYIPPIDIQFGEFLRAIITADADLVPDDPLRYRVAITEAFRKQRIFAPGAISMAPDSLMWEEPDVSELPGFESNEKLSKLFSDSLGNLEFAAKFGRVRDAKEDGPYTGYEANADAGPPNLRTESIRIIRENQIKLWTWLTTPEEHDYDWQKLLGIFLQMKVSPKDEPDESLAWHAPGGISMSGTLKGTPAVEIHSVRVARRQGPDGQELHQLIVQVAQKRRAYFDETEQQTADEGRMDHESDRWKHPDFWFRGGATILIDLRDGRLRRVIRKRIDNLDRLERERAYRGGDTGFGFSRREVDQPREPFAIIHRG